MCNVTQRRVHVTSRSGNTTMHSVSVTVNHIRTLLHNNALMASYVACNNKPYVGVHAQCPVLH